MAQCFSLHLSWPNGLCLIAGFLFVFSLTKAEAGKIMSDLMDLTFGLSKKKKDTNSAKGTAMASSDAKWTRNCDAAKLLKSMLENGEVAQGDLPKDVYKMREEFQRFPLKTFRNGFYNIKRDTGFHLRENIARNKGTVLMLFIFMLKISHSALLLLS
jgi:hypothetical protein